MTQMNQSKPQQRDNSKQKDVRLTNISSAKAVADAVRTSLGPKGMDKMVLLPGNEVLVTNDGATMLDKLAVTQPAAKMLVDLSKSQDKAAGDGTTTVTVLCGSLLKRCQGLLERGVHASIISDAFQQAVDKATEVLKQMSIPIQVNDKASLIAAATTSLSSKVVSQYSYLLAPMAVDAISAVKTAVPGKQGEFTVDLRDIKVISKVGGTVDDSELIDGLVFEQRSSKKAGGPSRVENAKVGLIQFQISPPKTDIENNIVVSDYQAMDRVLKEERNYILQIIKKIKASGCNVLLIQKSILRDAVTDLSLHYLAKAKILVVKDIEREDIEFVSNTLGCLPISHVDHMKPEKLGSVGLVEEVDIGGAKLVKMTGVQNKGRTATVLLRGSTKMVLEEAGRSLHDALCVVRCLVHTPFLVPGGAAPEMEVAHHLAKWAATLPGMASYCIRDYAQALEIIPYTLSENAGLNPIQVVSHLRKLHAQGQKHHGLHAKKGGVTDMVAEKVVQPLLVSQSALQLATECARMILKIDDIVVVR